MRFGHHTNHTGITLGVGADRAGACRRKIVANTTKAQTVMQLLQRGAKTLQIRLGLFEQIENQLFRRFRADAWKSVDVLD